MIFSYNHAQQYTKMKKKAQLKIWTTIAILIVFFVILMFGFIFYTQVEKISFERTQREAEARRSIDVAQVLTNLPELQCSVGAVERGICFDYYKLEVAEESINDEWLYYYGMFGYSDIEVKDLSGSGKNFTLYENQGDKTSYTTGFIPISIYDPIERLFSFGVIKVKSYYGQ